jgi:hypothetical protein
MLELTHPLFLSLALVVPLLLLAQRRSLADLTSAQRVTCFLLRALILLLLIGALAGVRLRLPSRDLAVTFVVDHSASVSPSGAEGSAGFCRSGLEPSTDR